MAQVEPMEVDNLLSDDKENVQNSNVFSRSPYTEKGYEDLDVSELNMKLRYSVTPASSPMSRSYTSNCTLKGDVDDNSLDDTFTHDNANLTHSLNSTITKDRPFRSTKIPLQAIQTSQFANDQDISPPTLFNAESNVTVTVTGNDFDDNLSLPSTSSSTVQTPEATTPTKEIPKSEGSPIMRGLKSVLNMFRPSYTPTSTEIHPSHEDISLESTAKDDEFKIMPASTPIASCKIKDNHSSKRSSPLKDSVTFNNDLERELQWKDDTTTNFREEKTSTHKRLFKSVSSNKEKEFIEQAITTSELNTTILNMHVSNLDVSCISSVEDKPIDNDPKVVLNSDINATESDSEFLDCETTYSKNESYVLESLENFHKIMPLVVNTSQTVLEGYVEDHIDPVIYKKDNNTTIESVTSIVESESNHRVSAIIEAKDLTCLSDITLTDSIKKHSNNNVILANTNESCIPYLKNVEKSLPVNILTVNLTSHFCIEENINIRDDINNVSSMSNTVKQKNEPYNKVESVEESTVSELPEKNNFNYISIEPTEITVTTPGITDSSFPPNHEHTMSVQNNKSLSETIQTNDVSYELCVNADHKINDSDDDPRNNETVKEPMILQFQNSENIKNYFIENNIENILLLKKDTFLSNTCTTDIGSNNNESIFKCENIAKAFNETFICEDVILSTNTHETNKNIKETINIVSENSVNSIKENVLLNEYVTSENAHQKSDNEDKITVMDCEFSERSDTGVISKDPVLVVKCCPISVKDIIIDSLESDSYKKNISHIENEMDISFEKDTDFQLTELKNNLPSEILLSDEIKNIRLGDGHSIKNHRINDCDGVMSKMETETSCVEDVSQPSQALDIFSSITEKCSNDKIETYCKIDSTKLPVIDCDQNKSDCKLLTTNNEDLQVNPVHVSEKIHTDFKTKIVKLPDIIQAASEASEKENLDIEKSFTTDISNMPEVIQDNVKVINEEILKSADNGLYISVIEKDLSSNIPTETLHNKSEIKIGSDLPLPITMKTNKEGYNMNFDESDNPFATKTKIRTSPPPGILLKSPFTIVNDKQKNIELQKKTKNKRKLQAQPKNTNVGSKCLNVPLENVNSEIIKKSNEEINSSVYMEDPKSGAFLSPSLHIQNKVDLPVKNEIDNTYNHSKNFKLLENSEKEFKLLDEITENDHTSVRGKLDGKNSKSVFNLPEIDETEFNPFVTKSRICQSPPPIKDNLVSKNNIKTTDNDTMDQIKSASATVCIEDNVEVISNVSSTTLKNSDEIHTEDEDTIEGPFIETENIADVVKVSDIEFDKDVVQFEDIPATSNNGDDVNDELFIDAETFDRLMNQNKSNIVVDSGKESLFLKFDPLFAKRVSSDGVLAALSSMQKKQSTPKKLTVTPKNVALEQTFNVSPSVESLSEENDALLYLDEMGHTISKPMMIVNPAVNSCVTPRKSTTPPNSNRRSLSFTSPAMIVIDRLLSQSDNTTLLDQDDLMPLMRRNHDADIALTQLREHLAEKKVHVNHLKCETKELRERLSILEPQVKSLENESNERLRKINSLNEQLIEKTKSNKTMAAVVEEYERTIATLITEIEQERRQNAEERAKLVSERDEQTAHLACMERCFSDLHTKYEKSKQIILSMKANEDTYKKTFKEFDDNLLKMHNNYEQLKQHATSKLNYANQELDKINRAHLMEVTKLNAMIKRKEMYVKSLEESLAQKIKANEDLTSICDELINRVG